MATAKLLYRRLDALFDALKTRRAQPKLVEAFLEDCFTTLRDDLRLRAGLLYAERRDGFVLVKAVGTRRRRSPSRSTRSAAARRRRAPPRLRLREPRHRRQPAPARDLPRTAVAGLIVGHRPLRYALFFLLADGWQMDELDFALNTIRAALGARLVDAHVRGSFREAAEIQQSLLEEPPRFPGFDLACRTVAAEEVGGDFYDFHELGEGVLGLAIGDASGTDCRQRCSCATSSPDCAWASSGS